MYAIQPDDGGGDEDNMPGEDGHQPRRRLVRPVALDECDEKLALELISRATALRNLQQQLEPNNRGSTAILKLGRNVDDHTDVIEVLDDGGGPRYRPSAAVAATTRRSNNNTINSNNNMTAAVAAKEAEIREAAREHQHRSEFRGYDLSDNQQQQRVEASQLVHASKQTNTTDADTEWTDTCTETDEGCPP